MRFTKAHATGNDFVLICDPEGSATIDAEFVTSVCERHRGIGADGLIRAVHAHRSDDGVTALEAAGLSSTAQMPVWFMDYRNADGSIAEMCGNGVRAFTHYLQAEGLATLNDGALPVLTRAGLKTVRVSPEGYAVGMGVWSFLDPELASTRSSDSLVHTAGLSDPRPGLSISMGNPHTVVALPDISSLEQLDLHQAPQVDPTLVNGTNVEFVVPAEPLVHQGEGRLRMRVHERGVGETMSCGTGACAAAAAVRVWAADRGVDTWRLSLAGGEVTVRFTARSDGAEETELSGPAVLVYTGELIGA